MHKYRCFGSDNLLSEMPALQDVCRSPAVHGALRSLLGEGYAQLGPQRNNADYTNVPRIRETFRWQQLEAEWTYFDAMTTGSADELFVKSARTHASMTAAQGSY